MSLDSVELLVEFENYFNIQVSDSEAEKMYTVQNAVDTFARLLKISENNIILKDSIFNKLKDSISKVGLSSKNLNYSDLVSITIPKNDKELWISLSDKLQLKVPDPPRKPDSIATKFLTRLSWIPKFNYNELTFGQLTDAICAGNYKQLINNKSINSKYEIYIAIMAITVDKIGVDVYEIRPEKSFTDDFGVD